MIEKKKTHLNHQLKHQIQRKIDVQIIEVETQETEEETELEKAAKIQLTLKDTETLATPGNNITVNTPTHRPEAANTEGSNTNLESEPSHTEPVSPSVNQLKSKFEDQEQANNPQTTTKKYKPRNKQGASPKYKTPPKGQKQKAPEEELKETPAKKQAKGEANQTPNKVVVQNKDFNEYMLQSANKDATKKRNYEKCWQTEWAKTPKQNSNLGTQLWIKLKKPNQPPTNPETQLKISPPPKKNKE